MKRKIFNIIFCVFMFIFGSYMSAMAVVSSQYDIQQAVNKLNELSSYNCISLINKNELIGYKLDNFNMLTDEYQKSVIAARDSIVQGLNKIELIQNSTDFSDSA